LRSNIISIITSNYIEKKFFERDIEKQAAARRPISNSTRSDDLAVYFKQFAKVNAEIENCSSLFQQKPFGPVGTLWKLI